MRRLLGACSAIAIVVIGLTVALPTTAFAHAHPIAISPGNGAELDEPPPEIIVQFSEAIDASSSRLILHTADGKPVPGAHQTAPGETTLVLFPPPLERGVYTVTWEVLSVDTHTTSGQFTFSVASSLPQTVPIDPGPAPGIVATPGSESPSGSDNGPAAAGEQAERDREFPWLWIAVGTGLAILFGVAMRRR